jgi:hypothetical protein
LDIKRGERIEFFGYIKVAATTSSNDIEAHNKCCVQALALS